MTELGLRQAQLGMEMVRLDPGQGLHCVRAVLYLGILKLDRLGDRDCCLPIQFGKTVERSDGAQEPSVSESSTTRPIYSDSVLSVV